MPQLQINQGPQDALLYDNTRSYFTNVGYVRTSNFQMELRDVQPVSQAQFGSRVDYVIPKSADLLGPIDLIVDLNAAETPSGTAGTNIGNYSAWVESLGYAMIEEMSFMIGSHTVEKITGDQMNIMNELMKGDNQRQHKLIGKTGRSAITLDVDESSAPTVTGTGAAAVYTYATATYTVNDSAKERLICTGVVPEKGKQLIIPLSFFFTKHPSQYFPLCAIAGCNDVRVSIKFRALNELLLIGKHNYVTSSTTAAGNELAVANTAVALVPNVASAVHPLPKFAKAIEAAQLRCHYVHVTGPEATTLMNKEHVRLMKLWHHQPTTFKVTHGAPPSGNTKTAPSRSTSASCTLCRSLSSRFVSGVT